MLHSLSEKEVEINPIAQFQKWWEQAIESKIEEVNAMTLATVNSFGFPSARIVLLKGYNENGFIFFTNYESRKGNELEVNPNASIVFFWKELERQIRIEGFVSKLSEKESTDYFKSRPIESQIGAWASPQSSVIVSRELLENNFTALELKYANQEIPKPPHWGGYILNPVQLEFWQGRPGRLHDRIEYGKVDGDWIIKRLAP
jgi:pyridoxamine 5'-phosphate oxidase